MAFQALCKRLLIMLNKEIKFLAKHSSIYGIGSVVGQVVGFLLLPLYTHYLSPADYGVLSLINITVSMIGIVVGMNVSSAMSRFYFDNTEDKKRKLVVSTIYVLSFLLVGIFLSSLILLTTPLSNLVFNTDEYSSHFLVALIGLAAGIIVDIGLVYLRIKTLSFRFINITIARLLINVGLNIYFIVYLETGLIGIFYSALIEKVFFVFIITIPILVKTKLYFSFHLAKDMVNYSFPLIFSNILRVFINESDKYFINYFFSPIETGLYSISQKISTSVHILITSPFIQTYNPRRFEIMKTANAKETYAQVLTYYLLAIGTFGLLLSLFSQELIVLMTTEEFYSAKLFIPLLVLSMIIFGMRYHFQIGILIKKKTKYLLYINFFAGIINLLLNFVMISRFGIWGAVLSINVSYGITTVLNYIVSQKLYRINFDLVKVFKLFAILISLNFISMQVSYNSLLISLIAKILLFTLYILLVFLFRIVDKRQVKLLVDRIIEIIKSKIGQRS